MRFLSAKHFLYTLALIASLCVFIWAASGTVAAAPTPTINYQGKLLNSSGAAVPDGTYNMRFWLLTSDSVATTSAVWTESLTSTNRVTVSGGLFSVMLGSTSPLTSVNFNQPLYLGVEIGSTTATALWDGEMSPRKPLGTVPAAFEADKLDGLSSRDFVRTRATSTISTSTIESILSIQQYGTGDILNLFDGNTEVFTVTDGGLVGIGTSTPGQELAVQGDLRLTGRIYDSANSAGTNGMILRSTGSGQQWLATSSLGIAISDTTGTLAANRGGTGLSSYATGDLLYATGASTLARRAIGSTGDILQVIGGVPTWVATSSLGVGDGSFLGLGDTFDSFTTGSVLFTSASAVAQDNEMFFFDNTNNRLQIGSNLSTGIPTGADLAVISTSTATARLAVMNTTGTDVVGIFDARNDGTASLQFGSTSNHPISIFTQNNRRALFGSTGGIRLASLGSSLADVVDPSAELDIEADGGTLRFDAVTGNSATRNGLEFYEAGSTFMSFLYDPSVNKLIVRDDQNSIDRLVVTQAGSLGVGTTSPVARLSVAGSTYLGGTLTATGTVTFTGITSGFTYANSSGVLTSSSTISASRLDTLVILSTEINTLAEIETLTGVSNILIENDIDASSELLALMDDETGTGRLVFNSSPAFGGTATFGALTATGTATFTTVDINGGAIDGATIGAASASTIVGTTITANTSVLPDADGGADLGSAALSWNDLFLDTAATINFDNGNSVITHSSGILTVSTGDLRVTTAGTNAASVVTVGGTQTLTSKTLTSPTISAPSISGVVTLSSQTASRALFTDASSRATTTATSQYLIDSISNETGTGSLVFSASPTLTGTTAFSYATGTSLRLTGRLFDTSNSAGTTGMVLKSTGTGFTWVATSTLGLAGAGAGITSLNGLTTGTQTFASSTSGTDFKVTSSGSVHTFQVPSASASARGLLTAANWTTFNNKVSSTSIDTSTELDTLVTDDTGSGSLVFATSPTLVTPILGVAAATSLNTSGIATSSGLTVTGLTSALTLTGANGVFAEYAGSGCTNQVTEDISALGVANCVSINNGYWSGTDLSVANGGTGLSTFGGTNTILYTTAADTLSSEAAFVYNPTSNILSADNIIANTGFFADANDGATLGSSTRAFSDLYLATGALIDFGAGNSVITHSSGILTVSTGDLRVTTAGTNAASVVTVGGTQTLTSKTLTSPTISAPSISGVVTLSSQTASRALFTDASSRATTTALSAALLNALTDETGTGRSVFNISPAFGGTATFGALTATGTLTGATANFSGNQTSAGYLRVGSASAPANTTAGDLTATRLSIGNRSTFGSGIGSIVDVSGTMTDTSGSVSHTMVTNNISPASDSSASFRAFVMGNTFNTSNNFTAIAGGTAPSAGYFENRITNAGTIASLNGINVNGITVPSAAASLGTVSDVTGAFIIPVNSFSNSLTSTLSNVSGIRVSDSSNAGSGPLTITNQAGIRIDDLDTATNNTSLLIGQSTIPTGNFGIYNASTNNSYFAGRVGIGTTSPAQELSVTGDLLVTGRIYDSSNSAGTTGMVLKSTGTGFTWVATSTLGLSGSSFSTSAQLAALLSDETGTGRSVFNISPAFGGTATFSALTATSTLTMSGTAANIALGSNWLSGDGQDEGVFVSSTGNVGVGTSTPTYPLSVTGGSVASGIRGVAQIYGSTYPTLQIKSTDTSGGNLQLMSSTGQYQMYVSGTKLFWYNGTTDQMVLTNGGSLGIGTTTPNSKLNILTGTTGNDLQIAFKENASNQQSIEFSESAAGYNANFSIQHDGSASNPGNLLKIRSDGGTNDGILDLDIMSFTQAGKVGIGTSTPNQKLSIFASAADAAIEFSTVSGANEKWTIGVDDSDGTKFKISSSSALGTNDRFVIDGAGDIGISSSTPYAKLTVQNTGAGPSFVVEDSASDTSPFYISASGLVGIGTTSPDYALDVAGAIVMDNGNFLGRRLSSGLVADLIGFTGNVLEVSEYTTIPDKVIIYTPSDAGNGVEIKGANTLAYFSNTGRVGIGGDITPDALLDISSSTAAANINIYSGGTDTDTSIGFQLTEDVNTFTLGIDDSDSDKFKISGSALGTNDRLVIDSSGNIGIGTSTPLTKLHVEGDTYFGASGSDDILAVTHSGTNQYDLSFREAAAFDGVGLRFDGSGTGDTGNVLNVYDFNGATPRVTFQRGGNVGIATTTPSHRLSIYANNTADDGIRTGAGISLYNANSGEVGISYGLSSTASSRWYTGLNSGTPYQMAYGSLFQSGSVLFTFTTAGRLGIGTSTPNQKLSIFASAADAAIEFSTVSGANEKWTIGVDDSDGTKFKISSSSALGTNDRFVINGNGYVGINNSSPARILDVAGQVRIVHNDGALEISGTDPKIFAYGNELTFSADIDGGGAGNLRFDTSNAERMVINSTGLVGIGTTTPPDRLSVHGAISFGDLNNGWNWRLNRDSSTSNFLLQGRRSSGAYTTVIAANDATGNVGIGTTTPAQMLTVGATTGSQLLVTSSGAVTDGSWTADTIADDYGGTGQSTYSTGDMLYASGANTLAKRTIGSTGNVLSVVGGVPTWVATSTLGLGGAGAGITSLNGLTTGTQTFASSTSGTDFKVTSSGSVHTFQVPSASASARGLLTAANWTTFNNKVSSTSIDTSTELAALLTDETGTGRSVFSASPAFTGTATFGAITATSTLTMSGTAANIALGSNYLSGDGDDEGIYVGSTGRVGIGTTTPNQALSIFRNGADAAIEFSTVSGSNEKWTLGIDDSDGGKFKISSSSALGTNDRFVINGAGYVGIGDANPSERLSISGNIALTTDSILKIVNNSADAWKIATSTSGIPLFSIDTTTGAEEVTIGLPGGDVYIGSVGGSTDLVFEESSTIHGQGGNTLTFGTAGDKINFAVNTGFGTTTAKSRLTVYGDVLLEGTSRYLNFGTASGTSGYGFRDNAGVLEFKSLSGAWAEIGSSAWLESGSDIYFSTGNVGIGTSTPNKRLTVLETVADAQFRLSYDATRYADFQVDSSGNLLIHGYGEDTYWTDDNIWACKDGACPSVTASSTGNMVVEGSYYFGNGYRMGQVTGTTTQIGVFNASGTAIIIFE